MILEYEDTHEQTMTLQSNEWRRDLLTEVKENYITSHVTPINLLSKTFFWGIKEKNISVLLTNMQNVTHYHIVLQSNGITICFYSASLSSLIIICWF